jgi:hypothetical protein
MRRLWTDIEERQVKWLADKGFGATAIAKIIGRPASSVYLKAATLGTPVKKRFSKFYPLTDSNTWDEADRICAFANVPLPLARLVVEISHQHNISVKSIRSACRLKSHTDCRMEIICEARERGYSLPLIGRAINRDHTTVIHSLRLRNLSPSCTTAHPRVMGAADARIAA